jgi:ABC-type cobalamin/Fe3+-siderophores transport system ATPase subunit
MSEATRSSERATLELRDVTIRRAGSALLSSLSVRSEAHRVGLIGDWEPLFQALTGRAHLSGSAQILGCELQQALSRGVVGFAPCDAPLPGSFSVLEYLRHAARLSHGSPARALADSKRALDEYRLSDLAPRKLAQLAVFERRALAIVCASLTTPPVLCLETPLRGLDAEPADYIARLCNEAAKRSRVIVSANFPSAPSPEYALLDACQELCVLSRGAALAQGAPNQILAPSTRYWLRVSGAKAAVFSGVLEAAGCLVRERDGVGRYLVELPGRGTSDLLLDAALASELVVLELRPLSASD